jgi:hypothetical protein
MTFFHGRWRQRVSLLAAGVLDAADEGPVRTHLDGCAACRGELEAARTALGLLARDPVHQAEVPLALEHLVARVHARLDAPRPAPAFRWSFRRIGPGGSGPGGGGRAAAPPACASGVARASAGRRVRGGGGA